jgi:hypothetical protein
VTTPNDILPLLTKNDELSEDLEREVFNYPIDEMWMYGHDIIEFVTIDSNLMVFECSVGCYYCCKLTDDIDQDEIKRFCHLQIPWD